MLSSGPQHQSRKISPPLYPMDSSLPLASGSRSAKHHYSLAGGEWLKIQETQVTSKHEKMSQEIRCTEAARRPHRVSKIALGLDESHRISPEDSNEPNNEVNRLLIAAHGRLLRDKTSESSSDLKNYIVNAAKPPGSKLQPATSCLQSELDTSRIKSFTAMNGTRTTDAMVQHFSAPASILGEHTSPRCTTWNHADSSPLSSQCSEHGPTAADVPNISSPATAKQALVPPLTNEERKFTLCDRRKGPASERPSHVRRKRDFSATVAPREASEEDCDSPGFLPLGLRNKRMKPTDCLLYAATLLSKKEDAASFNANGDDKGRHRAAAATPNESPRSNGDKVSPSCNWMKDDPTKPRDADVLCGRGGLVNKHFGNVVYRKVVDFNKSYYQNVHKKHRILVSQSIVQTIMNFGGRFLILGSKGKAWMEIGYKRAVQKTSQALRERPPPQEDDTAASDCQMKEAKADDKGLAASDQG